jgi:hypothetical protein
MVARDSWEYRTGTVAEMKLATLLRRSGWAVSIVRHGTAVAPMLLGWTGKLVLPDLQGFPPGGSSVWVEGKWKSTTGVMECMGNLVTTGLDLQNYQHYCEVQRQTGHPVVIAFMQREQDGIYLAHLDRDMVPAVGNAKGKMVYWDLAKLQRLCSYEELMATQAAQQQLEMPLFYPAPSQGRLW